MRPSATRRRLAVLLLAVAARAGPAAAVAADAVDSCAGLPVQVQAALASDRADVCRGARSALDHLRSQGLTKDPALIIEVVEQLPDVVGPGAAGCFIQERHRAYVLSYARFARKRTWFGVPITRELYRSLATHETAHAVAACHFGTPNPSIQAKEYVAYVTMFSTMPPALRARALRAMPDSGFADADRITSVVYLFDPMRFGVRAYRHFIALPDGASFLKDVMAGRVLAD